MSVVRRIGLWGAFGAVALLGGCFLNAPQPVAPTPAQRLEAAEKADREQRWSEAAAAALAYWVGECKAVDTAKPECARAQAVRGDAALALGEPDTAIFAFKRAA